MIQYHLRARPQRNARLQRQFTQAQRGKRRLLGRFENHRVACGQSRRDDRVHRCMAIEKKIMEKTNSGLLGFSSEDDNNIQPMAGDEVDNGEEGEGEGEGEGEEGGRTSLVVVVVVKPRWR